MDFEIVSIRQEVTLDIVLRYLRRLKKLPDHTDQVFVIDREERLMGTLPVDRILTHYPEDAVKAVSYTHLHSQQLQLQPKHSADCVRPGETAQSVRLLCRRQTIERLHARPNASRRPETFRNFQPVSTSPSSILDEALRRLR